MIYITSDVHLGLNVADPREREDRFVTWLKTIPRSADNTLVLLGDIWDFWYEYKYVIPKEGVRVVAQLIDLMDGGVKVIFFPGNHDIWTFHFFESIGIQVIRKQPLVTTLDGHRVLLAHGDGIGGATFLYSLMLKIFHSKFCQWLFSLLHPRIAFSLAGRWSRSNRRTHKSYQWKGKQERLYKFALSQSSDIEMFIFGHYHCSIEETLPSGSKLIVLKDWIDGGTPHLEL